MHEMDIFDISDIIGPLGQGRFATVNCYRRRRDNSLVAIKIYERSANHGRAQRIFEERAALELLANQCEPNPYIMKLINTEKNDKYLFFITEAILGGSMHHHIIHGFDKIDIVVGYAAEIVSALSHLACSNVAHRDLKCTNCILDGKGHIKLVDFGSSKLLEAYTSSAFDCMPKTFTIAGSATTMAPEMVGAIGHNFLVDWWALGVLIYEMICGCSEFDRQGLPGLRSLRADGGKGLSTAEQIDERDICAARSAIDEDWRRSDNVMAVDRSVGNASEWIWRISAHAVSSFQSNDDEEFDAKSPHVARRPLALDLVRRLLRPNPERRLGPCTALDGSFNGVTRTCEAVYAHPFFTGVDWDNVRRGLSPPPNPTFSSRSIGYLHYLDLKSDRSDDLSPQEQTLFADF